MTQATTDSLFRVRAAATDHWVVYRDADLDPIASFSDRASALAYALHLARVRHEYDDEDSMHSFRAGERSVSRLVPRHHGGDIF